MQNSLVRLLAFIIVIAFLVGNILLLNKDHSIERLRYVPSWQQLSVSSVFKKVHSEGVAIPAEKHPIFINDSMQVESFLVEKGDMVESGTPLFSYSSDHIEEQLALLNTEITSLEANKQSLATHIQDLEQIKVTLPAIRKSFLNESEIEKEIEVARQEYAEAAAARELILSLELSITEKEVELEQLEQQIKKYEAQRNLIEDGRDGLTILSPVSGIIESVSLELGNPVMTIVSGNPVIEGHLFEEQMKDISEGMDVEVHSPFFDGTIIGTISRIDTLPKEEPSMEKASLYPFIVELEDHLQELMIGYHVNADIIIASAEDVPIVNEKSLLRESDNPIVSVLTEEGLVELRTLTTGLEVGDRVEVKSGMELGEYYVKEANGRTAEEMFITPFKGNPWLKESWQNTSVRKMIKYMLIGVLQK